MRPVARPTLLLLAVMTGLAAGPARTAVPSGCEELVERVLEAVATRHYDATTRDRAASPVETPAESCAVAPGTREAVERALAPLDDPAIRLLDTDHFDRMIAEWSGRPVVGVGLSEVLSIDVDEGTGRLTVIAPVPGSPAAAAGLRAGDVVSRIDGIETDGLGLTRTMERLRVGAGETVGLEVLRSDGARGVVLTADSLPALPAFEAERIEDGDRELLLVRLHQFTPGVGDALAEAIASAAGVDGIVLDLRGNPGGFVDALVAVAGTFLEPDSEIARLAGPEPVELRVPAEGAPTRLPLSVLVDAGTASAAEALAAALRFHGRARIHGERTFGKGLAHDATPVEEGAWVLMLPVGDLETPAGERILGLGVDPDVRSADPLARAIRDLRGRPGAGEASAGVDREPFDFVTLDDGVFAAVARPDPPMAVFANALVAIGDDGVLVVDTHQSPSAARAVIEEIRRRTDLPVRWVAHTHWHGDHVYGDVAYREAFPDAEFVGHRTHVEDLATRGADRLREELRSLPGSIDQRATWLVSGVGPEGEALSDADRSRVERSLRLRRRYLAELERVELVPPDRTFERSLTIPLGGRVARLLHPGPAHTRGDVMVHLPESGVLAVGDLLEEGEPWIDEDTDVVGWARALEAIAAIDAPVLLPSHGGIQRDGSLLATYRATLDSLASGTPLTD